MQHCAQALCRRAGRLAGYFLVVVIFSYIPQTLATPIPDEQAPFQVGILPHLSPAVLMKVYSPLIEYLRASIKRPVIVSSAPNFKLFAQRTTQKKYDLLLTAPHLAAFAETNDRYRRLTRFNKELHGVIVVSSDSSIKSLGQLRGKTVATPDALAIITILGEESLMESGFELNKDVLIQHKPSHNSALLSIIEGRVDCAIVGNVAFTKFQKLYPAHAGKFRVIAKTKAVPHMMFMASPTIPDNEYNDLKDVLLNFNAKAAGKKFFADSVFGDMTGITDQDMQRLEPLLKILTDRM